MELVKKELAQCLETISKFVLRALKGLSLHLCAHAYDYVRLCGLNAFFPTPEASKTAKLDHTLLNTILH